MTTPLPLDPWSTALQATVLAVQHHAEVQNLWDSVWATLLKRNSKIVVTGVPGVGKTVLFDHLSSQAGLANYELPPMSRAPEKKRLKHGTQRWAVTIVPGQANPVKTETLEDAFRSGRPIDGVIYVVANGFSTLREITAERAITERGIRLSDYRENVRKAEIQDFQVAGDGIRSAFRRTRNRPHNPWLLIAVNKADLYSDSDEMQLAYRHYGAPGGAFYDEVVSLLGEVGSDNLRVEVLPVCSYAEHFNFGTEQVVSDMSTPLRTKALTDFMKAMSGLCDGTK